jgi:hypothetical protein
LRDLIEFRKLMELRKRNSRTYPQPSSNVEQKVVVAQLFLGSRLFVPLPDGKKVLTTLLEMLSSSADAKRASPVENPKPGDEDEEEEIVFTKKPTTTDARKQSQAQPQFQLNQGQPVGGVPGQHQQPQITGPFQRPHPNEVRHQLHAPPPTQPHEGQRPFPQPANVPFSGAHFQMHIPIQYGPAVTMPFNAALLPPVMGQTHTPVVPHFMPFQLIPQQHFASIQQQQTAENHRQQIAQKQQDSSLSLEPKKGTQQRKVLMPSQLF